MVVVVNVVFYPMGFRFFHNGCGHPMTVIVIAKSIHGQFHTHKREEERGKKRQQGFDATPAVMEPYILSPVSGSIRVFQRRNVSTEST